MLAAVVAVTLLAAPAGAQDRTAAQRLALQKQTRSRVLLVQQLQRQQTAQERERAQRLARQQAQRQRDDAARQARQQAQRLRQQQQRDAMRNWPVVTEAFTQTLRLGRNGTFDLQNAAGNIVVNGDGGDEVRIDAVKSVRHR